MWQAKSSPPRRRWTANWLEHHYFWMAYSYLGLLAAAVAETATRLPVLRTWAGGPTPIFWVAVVVATVAVFVVGGRVIRRRFEPTLRPFRQAHSVVPGVPPI